MTDTFDNVQIITESATHALIVRQDQTSGTNKTAMNIISSDVDSSCIWVTGHEKDKGTLKIGHVKPDGVSDTNAAGLSIYLSGTGTAAQGIFIDSDASTGKLLNLRRSGVEVFVVDKDGKLVANGLQVKNGASGTFKTADRKTVTVTKGIITAIN